MFQRHVGLQQQQQGRVGLGRVLSLNVCNIKHLLPFKLCPLYFNSLAMPLFDYADQDWGDKHNVTLMSSLQNDITKQSG